MSGNNLEPYEYLTGNGNPGDQAEDIGKIGDLYIDTETGDLYKKTDEFEWTFLLNLRGIQGPKGSPGAVIQDDAPEDEETLVWVDSTDKDNIIVEPYNYLSGEGNPEDQAEDIGKIGDLYIDILEGDLYRKIGDNEWTFLLNLKGSKGDKGDPGILFPTNGYYLFRVEGDDLLVSYPEGVESDDFFIDENGCLNLIIDGDNSVNLGNVRGEPGKNVNITGSLDSEEDLPVIGEINDSYIIDGDLYVWVGTGWENIGKIQGEQGPRGEQGEQGENGLTPFFELNSNGELLYGYRGIDDVEDDPDDALGDYEDTLDH